jgi:hypothetical protein
MKFIRCDHVFDDGSDIDDGSVERIVFGGFFSQEKNRPPRRLWAFETERYEASL